MSLTSSTSVDLTENVSKETYPKEWQKKKKKISVFSGFILSRLEQQEYPSTNFKSVKAMVDNTLYLQI